MNRKILVLSLLILLGAISRLIPHGYNFTPIAGIALIGGAYFHKKYLAVIVPILSLFISDFILNNYFYRAFFPDIEGIIFFSDYMIYTYLGTALIAGLGMLFLRQKVNAPRLLGSALAGTLLFFLVTNFGSWISNPIYPRSLSGVISSYAAGLPFLNGSLVGNLVFTFLLFTGYEYAVKRRTYRIFSWR